MKYEHHHSNKTIFWKTRRDKAPKILVTAHPMAHKIELLLAILQSTVSRTRKVKRNIFVDTKTTNEATQDSYCEKENTGGRKVICFDMIIPYLLSDAQKQPAHLRLCILYLHIYHHSIYALKKLIPIRFRSIKRQNPFQALDPLLTFTSWQLLARASLSNSKCQATSQKPNRYLTVTQRSWQHLSTQDPRAP